MFRPRQINFIFSISITLSTALIVPALAQGFEEKGMTRWRDTKDTMQSVFGEAKPDLTFSRTRGVDDESDDKVKQAESMLDEGKNQDALNVLNGLLKDQPKNGQALADRAAALLALHNLNYALADACEALKYEPKNMDALLIKASILFDQGEYDASVEECGKALKIHPDSRVLAIFSQVCCSKKRFVDASIAAEKALKMNGNSRVALMSLAMASINLGNLDLAVDSLNRLIAISPEKADAYVLRASAYLLQGKYDLAKVDSEKAIALDPKNDKANYTAAQAYIALGDKQRELTQTEALLKLSEVSPDYHRLRAYALEDSGDLKGASQEYAFAHVGYKNGDKDEAANDMAVSLIRLRELTGEYETMPSSPN